MRTHIFSTSSTSFVFRVIHRIQRLRFKLRGRGTEIGACCRARTCVSDQDACRTTIGCPLSEGSGNSHLGVAWSIELGVSEEGLSDAPGPRSWGDVALLEYPWLFVKNAGDVAEPEPIKRLSAQLLVLSPRSSRMNSPSCEGAKLGPQEPTVVQIDPKWCAHPLDCFDSRTVAHI